MLTTRNPEFDRLFRLWRQHGMTLSDRHRHESNQVTFEAYDSLGFNYRMTDVQAAIGRAQLAKLGDIVRNRRALAAQYANLLARHPELRLPHEPAWAKSNWQSYCVGLPDGAAQRDIMQALLRAGITTRRGIMCAHREPAYAVEAWRSGSPLGRSEHAQDHSILLPLYPGMTAEEQQSVAAHLEQAIASHTATARTS